MVVKSVREVQICGDPLTKFLFGKLGYKSVSFWLVSSAILFMTAFYYKTATTITLPFESSIKNVRVVPLFKDVNAFLFFILGICGIIIINYLLKRVPKIFPDLWKNGVIQPNPNQKYPMKQYEKKYNEKMEEIKNGYNEKLKELEKEINSKKSYILALIYVFVHESVSLYSTYRIPETEAATIAYHDIRFFPLSGISVHTTYAVIYFFTVVMLYKGIFLIRFFRKLPENFTVQVKPLHPDNCGGLKPIGNFCIGVDYMLLVFGIAVVSQSIFSYSEATDVFIVFILSAYVVSAIFLFFYPLWPIHNSMKLQKNDLLCKLNEELDPIYQEVYEKITKLSRISRRKLEKVEKWDRIYERTSEMPTWPFDVGGFLRFLTTILIPVVSTTANILVGGGG
ncbi:MAG: hypothetical protein AYK18_14680 [Theionarchaea archaeon DG-70]|nr:MAG: hypothetical protein AYK18_14680 [Theionarchaea archaeon DG-70]